MSTADLKTLFNAAWSADPTCEGSPGWVTFAEAMESHALADTPAFRSQWPWLTEILRAGWSGWPEPRPHASPLVAVAVAELLVFHPHPPSEERP